MNTSAQEMLLKIRAQPGWTESRIAAEIKTSQATVNRLLHGQRGCQAATYLAIESLATKLKLLPERRRRSKAASITPPISQPQ